MMPPMLRKRRGRILAVKWGLNPNSSSLGVDVTFLLVGAAALSMTTPFVSALVRLRASKTSSETPKDASENSQRTSPDESLAQP